MIPPHLLSANVNVRRRREVGRDSLNNPVYGAATDGAGWYTVYENMPAKLAFGGKSINFAPEGERILPTGIMYYNEPFLLRQEDRVLTEQNIEYIVVSLSVAYLMGKVVDHYEAVVQLP